MSSEPGSPTTEGSSSFAHSLSEPADRGRVFLWEDSYLAGGGQRSGSGPGNAEREPAGNCSWVGGVSQEVCPGWPQVSP